MRVGQHGRARRRDRHARQHRPQHGPAPPLRGGGERQDQGPARLHLRLRQAPAKRGAQRAEGERSSEDRPGPLEASGARRLALRHPLACPGSLSYTARPVPRESDRPSMPGVLQKIFGSHNDRVIKRIVPVVRAHQRAGAASSRRSPTPSCARARASSASASSTARRSTTLLPEAFATVREAAKRTLGQRHYDVQLIGGVVLHRGSIAEMRTGEGKTLVATLPAYLNALAGQRRAHRHRQRLPGAPRRRVDGPDPPLPRPLGRRDPPRPRRRAAAARPTRATSPTSPTTSSASTTCATT